MSTSIYHLLSFDWLKLLFWWLMGKYFHFSDGGSASFLVIKPELSWHQVLDISIFPELSSQKLKAGADELNGIGISVCACVCARLPRRFKNQEKEHGDDGPLQLHQWQVEHFTWWPHFCCQIRWGLSYSHYHWLVCSLLKSVIWSLGEAIP